MSIYLVEGERTVKQKVLFFVDACSKFDASVRCRNGKTIKEFVLKQKSETKPTNFKHICTLKKIEGGPECVGKAWLDE